MFLTNLEEKKNRYGTVCLKAILQNQRIHQKKCIIILGFFFLGRFLLSPICLLFPINHDSLKWWMAGESFVLSSISEQEATIVHSFMEPMERLFIWETLGYTAM